MKLDQLARTLGAELHPGTPGGAVGPGGVAGSVEVTGVAGIHDAGPDQLTFVANPKYAPQAHTTRAAAILVEPAFPVLTVPTLRIANPYLAFAQALGLFYQAPSYPPGVHPSAVIDPSASIGADTHIGPYVVIGAHVTVGDHGVILAHTVIYEGARIGSHFFAHAHAVVREHCRIGDHVTLQNGAMIGTDGFGFAKDAAGAWHKIPQSGPAVLEDEVEIQAQACVDRASVGETRIRRGVKIDNLVQVGHGSSVSQNTLLCAQVGLAGSTHIGRNSILAGQAGVAGHCTVGNGVIITAQSGTHGDIPDGVVISGTPGIPNRKWLRSSVAFQNLPETLRKLHAARKNEPA